MMVKAGFSNLAIDAFNSIGHENFNGIKPAIQSLQKAGAKNVLLYGPWPLHIPATERPIRGISYIPSATHIDLTDYPPRYWRESEKSTSQSGWTELPSYKSTKLGDVASKDWIKVCNCDACRYAIVGETDPRSIWRFGHFLLASDEWIFKVQDVSEKDSEMGNQFQCLWFQGPSYTSLRQCFEYPEDVRCKEHTGQIGSLQIGTTKIRIQIRGVSQDDIHKIRWGTQNQLYKWAEDFPTFEE
jgi:hypothetical protein